jgi:hypothetical protein
LKPIYIYIQGTIGSTPSKLKYVPTNASENYTTADNKMSRLTVREEQPHYLESLENTHLRRNSATSSHSCYQQADVYATEEGHVEPIQAAIDHHDQDNKIAHHFQNRKQLPHPPGEHT